MPAITSDRTTTGNQNSSSYDTAHRPLRLRPDDPAFLASTANSIASILISNFLPAVQPPRSENLVVASSGEDFSSFHDVTFDFFDEDDDLFGSPLAFDASDDGLWNGRFVPPPPRPPFFEDEPVLSDGLTTCDLCSWAMPTKSTFIFEGTIEKASELGWPLTLIIVSVLSALLGAIIMVTVVRCRRQKSSNNRNETHVQWWSRNKRPSNNNHLRRSNIYTAQPADSIRGLHQPALSASSSLTAMTAMGAAAAAIQASTAAPPAGASQQQQPQYFHQQQHMQQQFLPHALMSHQQLQLQLQHQHQQQHQPQEYEYEYEHEYHQPQELQLQLQQHQTSSSISSSASSPSLTTTTMTTMVPLPMQLQQHQHHHHQHQQQAQPLESSNNIRQNGSTMAVAS